VDRNIHLIFAVNQNNNTMTPQESKELFLQTLESKIKGNLSATNLTTRFETCSSAPSFGWSVEEYMYMPLVAERLRKQGYRVTSQVNHGVTDWTIAV
jgi:hypothetical protein